MTNYASPDVGMMVRRCRTGNVPKCYRTFLSPRGVTGRANGGSLPLLYSVEEKQEKTACFQLHR